MVNIESFILLVTKKGKFAIITLEKIEIFDKPYLSPFIYMSNEKDSIFYLGQVFGDIAHCAHMYLGTAFCAV